jgi:hypothetical protein
MGYVVSRGALLEHCRVGDGTFQPPRAYTVETPGYGNFTFAVGDINSDGKQDLIVNDYSFNTGAPQLLVFLGNGD